MPKKPTQRKLFGRETPQMPEGYYSSGPNPNLGRFVEQHATPYDPETDHYNVKPFDKPITTTKATAIYNMHTYWSKKPHDAIRQYIRHYTQPGDLVLDPFCGSGSTALAALMEGRAAIAIDLSPAATFITKNYCTPVDVEALQAAFEELQAQVQPEMDWLYETRCDRCGGKATTSYTVYSQTFQCPRCLEIVPLFDCVEVEEYTGAGKPKTMRVCPHCHARGHDEEIKNTGKHYGAVPVLVSYECQEGCKPKRGQRQHNDPNARKREHFQRYDLGKIQEIEARPIPHWVPPHRMMNVESDTEPWGDKWRRGTSNFRTVAELFTKRNLWALAAIRKGIMELSATADILDALTFAFQGILLINSRMCRYETTQTQNGTYYLPPVYKELVPMRSISSKLGVREKAEKLKRTLTTDCLISTQSAMDLGNVPSVGLDYIFTDPPYAGKVQYGELNFVWEAWLGFDANWHEGEIIVNETRDKTEGDWADMMRQAMRECYRVLKPGRWISLCYHDTSEGTWQLVQDIMTEVGFIPEQTDKALYIDAGQKSYNQLIAEKVTKRDLVINFRKPRPGEVDQLTLDGAEDPRTFQQIAQAILKEALERHPGSPADRLYDELVSRMVRQGRFERHNFDELLHSVAEDPRGDNHWYSLESADAVDPAEGTRMDAIARRLEQFMHAYLEEHPEETGVHYSELFERYLPVADKPRRLLQDWLPEYFVRTPEGTWRPPETEEERMLKEELRANGTLRRIKRFTSALLEGVPPAERDRPENVATAAEWLRQCRRVGLYDLGRALYERGGFAWNTLDEMAELDAQEDYEVCVRGGK